MIFRLRTYALSIIAVLMFGDIAHAEQWQVVQTSVEIWITTETVQPVSLGSVSELPDGSTLITGEHGRVMLMRGERSMIIGPNSVVMVPPEIMGRTTVIQRIGEILFDIDKRNVKHFAVETPYLAAVVKGTNFTVLVEPTDAVVSVNKGRVEVKSILTGETVEIGRGQIAAVRGLGAKLTVTGSRAGSVEVWPGEARAPIVRPLPNNKLTALQGVWFELDAAKKDGGKIVDDRDGSVLFAMFIGIAAGLLLGLGLGYFNGRFR